MSEPTDKQRQLLEWLHPEDWARPMDLGAFDSSYHSRVLTQLVKRGLAERRTRSTMWGGRGSYVYRRSAEGQRYLEARNADAVARAVASSLQDPAHD